MEHYLVFKRFTRCLIGFRLLLKHLKQPTARHAPRANMSMAPTEDQHHTEGKDLGNRRGKVARVAPTVKHSPESFRAGLIVHQLSGKHQGR